MNCPCPHCNREPLTAAEHLINLAETVLLPKRQMIHFVDVGMTEKHIERAVLAVKFYRLPAGTKLRAMLEEWPMEQIIREVH